MAHLKNYMYTHFHRKNLTSLQIFCNVIYYQVPVFIITRTMFCFVLSSLIGVSEESGAQPTIYCVVEESITNLSGGYFANCCLIKESDIARDAALARKLWEVSCQATGLKDTQ